MKRNITLIIIVSLVVLVTIPFLVVSLFLSKKEVFDFSNLSGELYYHIDIDELSGDFQLGDTIELTEEDIDNIYKVYKEYNFETDDYEIDLEQYDYEIRFEDTVLMFDDEFGIALYNDTALQHYANDKELNRRMKEILEKINSTEDFVYLFDLRLYLSTTVRDSKNISDEDVKLIRECINEIKELSEPNNLAIALDYILVVDDINIYFDDLDGLAMLENKMVVLPENLINILHKYLNIDKKLENDNDNECCSCCPDLKPGESCIALCCPCADNR